MISEYFPQKTVRIYSKDKPFMTSKIKRLILKRNIKKTKKLNLWEASENKLRQRFREQRCNFTRIKYTLKTLWLKFPG